MKSSTAMEIRKVRSTAEILNNVKVSFDKPMAETDEEINARIAERFDILGELTEAAIIGDIRAMIVSGPAGLGKSYTVEQRLSLWDPEELNHTIIKGFVRATGLLKMLYKYRNFGQVIVFDDADSIFFDDVALNLLKAVCDTTEKRRVSWLSEGKLVDEETGVIIPNRFDFDGTIIFISNIDFDDLIEKGHKLTPHLEALMSRALYIDLTMKTRRDYLIRIRQVVDEGMLSDLTEDERNDVLDFIEDHSTVLRELSLRIAVKLAGLRKQGAENFPRLARVTCCRQ